jgi:flagellin-specific chaperone FliS
MAGLGDIKNFWRDLVKRYSEFAIDEEITKQILDELHMTKNMRIRVGNYTNKNLWELFQAVLREISLKNYKSDIHKAKKVEKLVEIFYNFSIQTRLTA